MDLTVDYLGIRLRHPFITGAGPLADSVDMARRLEDAGAAAIVMRSLFEEQLVREELHTHGAFETHSHSTGEALSYLPDPADFVLGPQEYLEQLRRLKEAVSVPVFASLNGTTRGSWLRNAKLLQEAGADAIELNLFTVPVDPSITALDIEDEAVEMVREVKEATGLPLAVKLSPFYTSLAHFARRLHDAGARGLVLFNRFSGPDVDIEELEVSERFRPSVVTEVSLRLRWLAVVSARVPGVSLAITGGMHRFEDAVKAVMCGASAVQLVSAILQHGPEQLTQMKKQMEMWMEEKGYASLLEMRGSMNLARCPDPRAYERGNYVRLLQTWGEGM
jgi:dihydroorotate dehydrogenase (fumarate)